MKTRIVGILAIIIALGASAFTSPSFAKPQTSYVWFKISGALAPGAAVPKADASYISTGTAPMGGANGCSGSSYQCVSGFASSQVTGTQLKNDSQTPAQQPYQHD